MSSSFTTPSFRLLIFLLAFSMSACLAGATDDDDDTVGDDDDTVGDDDDTVGDDDDTVGDDDDSSGDDDDTVGDDDDSAGDDDDTVGDDDDSTPSVVDDDGDSYDDSVDCDDDNAAINPGATEVCDLVDNNCNSVIDEGFDADSDGVSTCGPDGVSGTSDDDCDDSPATGAGINPGATEVCDPNDTDEDCNGFADGFDSGVTGTTYYYPDTDGDSYGDGSGGLEACEPPANWITDNSDCDDSDDDIHPGATEHCDGVDNDCDAATTETNLVTEQRNMIMPMGSSSLVRTTTSTQSSASGTRTTLSTGSTAGGLGFGSTLKVCEGTHYVDITVSGNGVIEGVGNRLATNLSGSDEGTVVRIVDGGSLRVSGLQIIDGSASHDVTFTNGTTYQDVGGGLLCDRSGTVTLDNAGILLSSAIRGGGLYAYQCDVVIENNSNVSSNDATRFGGGMYVHTGDLTITDSYVELNSAGPTVGSSSGAGGVYANGGTFTLTDSLVGANSVSSDGDAQLALGGGAWAHHATVVCSGGSGFKGFTDNTVNTVYYSSSNTQSDTYASALALRGTSTLQASDCDFGSGGSDNPGYDVANWADSQCNNCASDANFDVVMSGGSSRGIVFWELGMNWDGTCVQGQSQSGALGSFHWNFDGIECS
jgi:hypothetical protein